MKKLSLLIIGIILAITSMAQKKLCHGQSFSINSIVNDEDLQKVVGSATVLSIIVEKANLIINDKEVESKTIEWSDSSTKKFSDLFSNSVEFTDYVIKFQGTIMFEEPEIGNALPAPFNSEINIYNPNFSLKAIPKLNFGSPVIDLNEYVNRSIGSWSGTGVLSNKFDTKRSGSGSHKITYTVNNNGCSKSEHINVNVSNPISFNLPFKSICKNDSPITLSGGKPEEIGRASCRERVYAPV